MLSQTDDMQLCLHAAHSGILTDPSENPPNVISFALLALNIPNARFCYETHNVQTIYTTNKNSKYV